MPRLLFEKTGNAVWISHLDLMRVFQRAFKRAGLPLTHTQGYNPRPSVSIALPMSVGVHSRCELLDFDLEEAVSCDEIEKRLNAALISGVRVQMVYENGVKLKYLGLMDCTIRMVYDAGVPVHATKELAELFARPSLTVEKKGKNGVTQQDIIPMIRKISFAQTGAREITVSACICCQEPTLNPMQIVAAVGLYAKDLAPCYAVCCREEIYTREEQIFR